MSRRIRIMPVLLLDRGGLYKTVKFGNPVYVGDPINAVRIFSEKETDELILLDYKASKENRAIDFTKIAEIAAEAFMPMSYGGAIRTLDDAKRVFDSGFEKVVLNSVLFNDPDLPGEIASIYGTQAVVGSVDVRRDWLKRSKVYSHSGQRIVIGDPADWVKTLESRGVGEIMLTSVDADGTWSGYQLDMIQKVSAAVSVPVIACGGAGSVTHWQEAVDAGASAVAAGSMFVFQRKGMGVLISFPSNHSLQSHGRPVTF